MPERAAETRQVSDDTREELIAKAAGEWAAADGGAAPPGDLGRAVGDLPGFLSAYYRLVAAEDLIAAGPARLAATAAQHAALGAGRPQGRPAVSVRPGADASLTGAETVIDIVTDDMPYLVDSVTMELNRHGADILLIVHPLLTVHRDVAGAAHGTSYTDTGARESDADAVRESWIHVEIGHVDDHGRLAADLRRVLDDLRVAMEDQRRMRSAARDLVELLADGGPEEAEASELLAWLSAGHFTFLGYRAYDLVGDGDKPELKPVPGTGLGILRHDGADSFAVTPPGGRHGKERARLLVLAKSSTLSTVYRPSYLDYVAVRRFSQETGEVIGEYRFLGLYTQAAYTESVTRIPVLRHKVDRVLESAGVPADSHDGKALIEILEGYPREELFEISAEQLAPIAMAVLGLAERKQVRLFLRPDAYGRYVSCLVYLPRDRYTTQVRLRAQEILRSAFGGSSVDYSAMVGNSALARLHVVVHATPGCPLAPVDQAALQARVAAAVRSWDDDLAAEAQRQLGAGARRRGAADLRQQHPPDVQGRHHAGRRGGGPGGGAAAPRGVRALRPPPFDCPERVLRRLRVFRLSPLTLSDVLPQLQHMGLEVLDEHPYEFGGDPHPFWIYDFGIRAHQRAATAAEAETMRAGFEAALTALWHGQTEDDEFNGLVLDADLTWRQVVVLRAYARYLRQAGIQFSQNYLQRVLRANPAITRLLVRLFESRFDPTLQAGAEERCTAITEELRGALDEVVSLDHDRILRSYLALIEATLRTNYFQQSLPGGRPPRAARTAARASRAEARAGKRCALPRAQARLRAGARGPRAAAEVRDLGLLAPARGGAPAVRRGRARRPALVGTARGLPHRGTRPGQGAGGEELGHRAVRREGRVRLQAAARPGRHGTPTRRRCSPATGRSSARCSTSPTTSSATPWSRRPAWSGWTATTRTWSSPPTRAPRRSPTWPTRSPAGTGTGSATRSPRAAPRATTTRRWASPRAAPGSRSAGTSRRCG